MTMHYIWIFIHYIFFKLATFAKRKSSDEPH